MNDCPRLNRWIRGCKFRPRYDHVDEPSIPYMVFYSGPPPAQAKVTYVGDVCETCGKMLFKRKAPQ